MIKITCDKCKKKIDKNPLKITTEEVFTVTFLMPNEFGWINLDHHFCGKCYRDISTFIYQEYLDWGDLGWKKK